MSREKIYPKRISLLLLYGGSVAGRGLLGCRGQELPGAGGGGACGEGGAASRGAAFAITFASPSPPAAGSPAALCARQLSRGRGAGVQPRVVLAKAAPYKKINNLEEQIITPGFPTVCRFRHIQGA